ncbi:NAD(P)/FAD-dependent oxidoreductase [soil metagenome]
MVVLEAEESIGGGTRSAELTLPGFVHDICSAVHPLGAASPAFRKLPLEKHGLSWIQPDLPLAHALDGGRAAVLYRSLDETVAELGDDGAAWRKLFGPLLSGFDDIVAYLLGPPIAGRVSRPPPVRALPGMLRFAVSGLSSATGLSKRSFSLEGAPALLGGMAAHAMLPLDRSPTAGFGLLIGLLGHGVGWPVAAGGSQSIADALAAHLRSLGGEIKTSHRVRSMNDLPRARATLFNLTPRRLLEVAGTSFPTRFRKLLQRFPLGPGIFKVDWALDGPVPWTSEACRRAGTVHLGGTLEELAAAESAVAAGRHPERPYVLIAQQSLFDPGRAPAGKHTLWGYCHVPNGSGVDMTDSIESQIERFAPSFRDLIIARNVMGPAAMEAHDSNFIGGDISGGLQDLRHMFVRPSARWNLYTTPNESIYICSSSTPPGGGVHGMCGYHAAGAALKRSFGITPRLS